MPDATLLAETVPIAGHNGDLIPAYLARPLSAGPVSGVLVIHHMPGWDGPSKEITRRFAAHGYAALCPNLHHRAAPGAAPDDAAAAARAAGGVPDEQFVGDAAGAVAFLRSLPNGTGKVGCIGYCSGGRQSFLAACSLQLNAAVDCYGACVVNPPPANLSISLKPIAHLAPDLSCPLLGLFGEEDKLPTPEETAELAAILERHGKSYDFHTYPGAGHAFFAVDRPSYRPEVAKDGWERVFAFYATHLAA